MSPLFQTNGIIIKEEERGEADRVLTVFTEDFGKIRLYAKGARKITSKLAGRLALFNLISLHFVEGKRRKIITDVYVINNFINIKQNLNHLKIALYSSQIIDNLIISNERDEKLWKIIPWIFESANKGQISGTDSLLLRLFEVKLLDYLGYFPNFSKSNPHSFNAKTSKILDTLAHNHQEINQISCAKKDLLELKQATTLMMSMIY